MDYQREQGEQLNRRVLHEELVQLMRSDIVSRYSPGDSYESERSLAKRYNVSLVTIKQAMLLLASEGYIKRTHGRPAEVLDPQSRQHVGILMPAQLYRPKVLPFYWQLVEGLGMFFHERGYRSQLYRWVRSKDSPNEPKIDHRQFHDDLARRSLSGLVAVGTHVPKDIRRRLEKDHVPLVGTNEDSCPCSVRADSVSALRDSVEYLLRKGSRKIALLSWHERGLEPQPRPNQLLQAFRDGLDRAGVECNERWIRMDTPPAAAGAGWSGLREIWSACEDKPDGLVITDDVMYREAAMAILQMGIRVPEDMRVVTFANTGSGMVYPFPTAAVLFDLGEWGHRMGGMILQQIDGQKPQPRQFVRHCWIEDISEGQFERSYEAPTKPTGLQKPSQRT